MKIRCYCGCIYEINVIYDMEIPSKDIPVKCPRCFKTHFIRIERMERLDNIKQWLEISGNIDLPLSERNNKKLIKNGE